MEKILLTLTIWVCALGANAQAVPGDTIVYQDFENGLSGWYNSWGGSVHAVANPFPTPENSSDTVIYMNTDPWVGALIEFQETDFMITEEIYAVLIDVYTSNGAGSVKFFMDNSASNAVESYSEISSSVVANTWHTVSFLTTNLPAYDFKQVAFQLGIDGTTYFDNIRLVKRGVVASFTDDEGKEALAVYPNPVSSTLNLGGRMKDVNVISVMGEVIYSARDIERIDVSEFEQGLYYVRTELGTTSFMVK